MKDNAINLASSALLHPQFQPAQKAASIERLDAVFAAAVLPAPSFGD